jgi:hypothetical protein
VGGGTHRKALSLNKDGVFLRTLPVLFASFVVFAVASWLSESKAHSWYEPACCSGRDCEPLDIESVIETAEGWTVSYLSKQGFLVKASIPHGKERHSQDGRFHACASSTRFLCLYVPSNA